MQKEGTALLVAAGNLKVGENVLSFLGAVWARGAVYTYTGSPYVALVTGSEGFASVSRVSDPTFGYVAELSLSRYVRLGEANVIVRPWMGGTATLRKLSPRQCTRNTAEVNGVTMLTGFRVAIVDTATGNLVDPSANGSFRFDVMVVGVFD